MKQNKRRKSNVQTTPKKATEAGIDAARVIDGKPPTISNFYPQGVTDDTRTTVPPLTLYVRDRATNAHLAEVRMNPNATLGELRSRIRDCPEMAAFPQRMFSHWWVKTGASVFPIEIPTDIFSDEYLLSEAGIVDEGTLLLELRGAVGDVSCALDGSDVAVVDTDEFAAAVVAADRRSEQRMDVVLKALADLKKDNAELKASHAQLSMAVSRLEKDNAAYADDFALLNNQIRLLQSDNTEMKGRAHALQNQLKADVAQLTKHIASVKSDTGGSKRDTAQLKMDTVELKTDLGVLKSDNDVFQRNIVQLRKDNADLKVLFRALRDQGAHNDDATRQLQAQMVSCVNEVSEAVSVQPHPSYPPMTVATACGPSTFGISYPRRGTAAVIVGHEQYFNLPSYQKGRDRAIYFPKATIAAGARCLVEFSIVRVPSFQRGCGLNLGFVPASSSGLHDFVHDIRDSPNSFTLSFAGSNLYHRNTIVTELPKIGTTSSVRRVALLMDRTDAANSFLRVFVSENGTNAGVKTHGDAKTVIKPTDVDYIPAANPYQCELTIHNIYFGNDIPRCYAL